MNWSPQQERAIDAVGEWLKNPTGYFKLFGYAGTGKTTITKHLAANADGHVVYAAYTGKAAHVMRRNGCDFATTIHKLIYRPRDKCRLRLKELEQALAQLARDGADEIKLAQLRGEIELERRNLRQPAFTLNPDSEAKNASLIVIDEVSMVGANVARDLLSFGKPLLVIGDPAQLPPVAQPGFFTVGNPDIMLTEIHRQALDNPIIQLATAVRNGEALALGQYGDSEIVPMGDEIVGERVRTTDQILVGLRRSRAAYNERMLEIAGLSGDLPQPGAKLVNLKNDHQEGFLNGSLWKIDDVGDVDEIEGRAYMTVSPLEADDYNTLPKECWAWLEPFKSGEAMFRREDGHQSFTYGYVLTCHKAQGSQWDDVVAFDESGSFRENSSRWLYTAITRAAKRITIVR